MAQENEDGQEKSEDPTGRRIEKSRQEGQVARSKELTTTFLLMLGTGGILLYGESIGLSIKNVMVASFSLPRYALFDVNQMGLYFANFFLEVAIAVAPLLFILFLAGIIGSIALGGWLFSWKSLQPKFSKLNPVKGLGKMFSLKSLVELLKSVAKIAVVVSVAVWILYAQTPILQGLAQQDVMTAMTNAVQILGWSFFTLSSTMILVALFDVPFQIYDHHKQLKMTKQEVKDEFKDTEGKPEVKQRIRQLQYEMSQRQMLKDVPDADVVITNPTHFSVALKYDPESEGAPILLAKGHDHMALKIREIAKLNDVEIVGSPPLARSIYHHSEIGQEIPSGLYMAVAQVLAYVFQLKQFRRRISPRPQKPDFPVPDDMSYDG